MTKISGKMVENALYRLKEDKILKDAKNSEYKVSNLSKESFWGIFCANAEGVLRKRGVYSEFVVDEDNKHIINDLYLYLIGSKECKLNINAGILIGGTVGCGKSVLLESFILTYNSLCVRPILSVHAKDIAAIIKKEGVTAKYRMQPLYIDDLGRESDVVKDFGNVITPMVDLIAARYDAGARTFATTNFKYEVLELKYTPFITSRLKEMMNQIILISPSRRIVNEPIQYGK